MATLANIEQFLSIAVLITVTMGQSSNVSVSTAAGNFIGFKKNVTVDGATVELNTFLGIPYAEAPIGELRFQKPVRKAVLPEPLIVHEHGPECIQIDTGLAGQVKLEDCLFLNIYAPNTGGPLAVMIWIHGGGYVVGSANLYVSDRLAARGNVIVVTLNYRLSVLGFLNIGDKRPSNYGLWDQNLAIRWVNENIEAFGGDKDRITIFGESAGAGSVIYQGLYPGNRGLFQRIIAESGSASSPWSESLDPLSEANEFAALVGCKNNNKNKLLDCLKRVPGSVVSDTLSDIRNNLLRFPIPFVPSIDNDFVKVSPRDILNGNVDAASAERNTFASFDLIIGSNSGEGISFVAPSFGIEGDINSFLPNRTFFENTLVPRCIQLNRLKGDENFLSKLIISTYTSWDEPENPYKIRENFLDMYGDIDYIVPAIQTVDIHRKYSGQNSYMYLFAAVPSNHFMPTLNWTQRANHADELQYVFGNFSSAFEDWEEELSRNMMIMWSNFAKTGNPNRPRDLGMNWQLFTEEIPMYMEIGKTLNETISKENLIEKRAYTWNQLLSAVDKVLLRRSKSCDQDTSGSSSIANRSLWFFVLIAIYYIQI